MLEIKFVNPDTPLVREFLIAEIHLHIPYVKGYGKNTNTLR